MLTTATIFVDAMENFILKMWLECNGKTMKIWFPDEIEARIDWNSWNEFEIDFSIIIMALILHVHSLRLSVLFFLLQSRNEFI